MREKQNAPFTAGHFAKTRIKNKQIENQFIKVDSSCQIPPSREKNLTAIDILMLQAEAFMESNATRFADHFQIWLSLFFLKNRLRWPGVNGDE